MADPRNPEHYEGGCLCGAVRYRVKGELRDVINCFCEQCRRTSGHHVAATAAAIADLELSKEEGLTWFRSSKRARRGFCAKCGSNLFWQRDGAETTSIMAGTVDTPTGLATMKNIFLEEMSDYHTVPSLDPRAADQQK